MEVNPSEWRPETLKPLGKALAYNTAFLAFKAADAPQLGARLVDLAPLLATNSRLISFTLDNVAGTPEVLSPLLARLATNVNSRLSVINLAHNTLGDAGGDALAASLRTLRAGLLAELHLSGCSVGPKPMAALLTALHSQRNLLQLHANGNSLAPVPGGERPSDLLVSLLSQAKLLEQLSIGDSNADLSPFAALPSRGCAKLAKLDASGLTWGAPLLALIGACGALASLNLARGAATTDPMDAGAFLAHLLSHIAAAGEQRRAPSLQLELSVPNGAAALLSPLLFALPSSPCPPGLVVRNSALGDQALLQLLIALVQQQVVARHVTDV